LSFLFVIKEWKQNDHQNWNIHKIDFFFNKAPTFTDPQKYYSNNASCIGFK